MSEEVKEKNPAAVALGRLGGCQKGKPKTKKHNEANRTAQIFRIIAEAAEGKRELLPGQQKAAELYLKKTMPDLSSVEQTIINDDDAKPIEIIYQELQAIIKANPELLAMLTQSAIQTNESMH